MKITITKTEKTSPAAILHLEGILDGSNFETLIEEAKKLYTAGARDLILDLSKLTFISSAGLGALHHVALLFRGKNHSGGEETWASYRWAVYRNIDRDRSLRLHEHVKLFSPTKEVRELLELIGFTSLFEIFTELPAALASFRRSAPVMEASLK